MARQMAGESADTGYILTDYGPDFHRTYKKNAMVIHTCLHAFKEYKVTQNDREW